jgi:uncharacterized protein
MPEERISDRRTVRLPDDSGEDPFELWRRASRECIREHEKERLRVLSRVVEALDRLASDYTWKEAYLFGSIVKPGRFHCHSDVDVSLLGLSKYDHYAFVGDLSMLIERPADVIRLEECPFAEAIVSEGVKWRRKER